MEIYSANNLAIVGVVSAVVHMIVRALVQLYPKFSMVLLNVMLLVNVLLLIYYSMAIATDDNY
jgi:hypothetical protein